MQRDWNKGLFLGVVGGMLLLPLMTVLLHWLDPWIKQFFYPLAQLLSEAGQVDSASMAIIVVQLIADVLVITLLFIPLMIFYQRSSEVLFSSFVAALPAQLFYLLVSHRPESLLQWLTVMEPLLGWLMFIQIPPCVYPLRDALRRHGEPGLLTGASLVDQARQICHQGSSYSQCYLKLYPRIASVKELRRVLSRTPLPDRVLQQGFIRYAPVMLLTASAVVLLLVGLSGFWMSGFSLNVRSAVLILMAIACASLAGGIYAGQLWALIGAWGLVVEIFLVLLINPVSPWIRLIASFACIFLLYWCVLLVLRIYRCLPIQIHLPRRL